MTLRRAFTCSSIFLLALVFLPGTPAVHSEEWTADNRGSPNIKVISHLPLGPRLNVSDIDVEQDLDRPYAYVGRMVFGGEGDRGMDIIDISDPANPKRIYKWRIENQDLHVGLGGMDVKHFKWKGRNYVVQSLQFKQGGPDADLGAVVLDVTGLPDPNKVKEVARIRAPDLPEGFHNIFVYRHTNGRVLLFATASGPFALVYDLGYVVEGYHDDMLVAKVPVPAAAGGPREISIDGGPPGGELPALLANLPTRMGAYHDFYVGYHVDTDQDRFYGGGTGGYYIYNVTDLEEPQLVVSLTGIRGVRYGHTFTPTSDGRYVVAETEYQYAPLRIFDLKPALDGEVKNINQPISAWTANWKNVAHNHEIRWPYVFVSGYLDGLQIFSLMDPKNPVTVGYYDTYLGPPNADPFPVYNGCFGVDIRNADGLIVVSDMTTGFWVFRMDGFQGWNGEDWGVPNISSAQDWETGPNGGNEQ